MTSLIHSEIYCPLAWTKCLWRTRGAGERVPLPPSILVVQETNLFIQKNLYFFWPPLILEPSAGTANEFIISRYFTWYEGWEESDVQPENPCFLVGFNLREACSNLKDRCVLLRECSQFNETCTKCQVPNLISFCMNEYCSYFWEKAKKNWKNPPQGFDFTNYIISK